MPAIEKPTKAQFRKAEETVAKIISSKVDPQVIYDGLQKHDDLQSIAIRAKMVDKKLVTFKIDYTKWRA